MEHNRQYTATKKENENDLALGIRLDIYFPIATDFFNA